MELNAFILLSVLTFVSKETRVVCSLSGTRFCLGTSLMRNTFSKPLLCCMWSSSIYNKRSEIPGYLRIGQSVFYYRQRQKFCLYCRRAQTGFSHPVFFPAGLYHREPTCHLVHLLLTSTGCRR